MHSRIVEIRDNFVDEDDYYTEDDVPEWFSSGKADYVTNSEDRDGDIEWLISNLGSKYYNIDGNKIVFTEGFKEEYFKALHERFLHLIKELSDCSLENFIFPNRCDVDINIYKLNEAYNDEHAFYIENDYGGLETLSEWIRHIEYNKPYYIGGTVDYHY